MTALYVLPKFDAVRSMQLREPFGSLPGCAVLVNSPIVSCALTAFAEIRQVCGVRASRLQRRMAAGTVRAALSGNAVLIVTFS